MTSFFGGRTEKNLNEQNHKMIDGPIPEVAAHSYEGAPSVKNNDDTLGLKKAREVLFGSRAKQDVNSVVKTLEQADVDDTSKALHGGTHGFGGLAGGAPLVRPTGILVSEEGIVSGKRYADRPEGIDQFGAEEAERDPDFLSESSKKIDPAKLARYKDRPEGLDQFGGEESERDRVELGENETRQLKGLKEWPEGIDQFGGELNERVLVEMKDGERREVRAEDLKRFKDQPQGLDLFGGEEAERKI